MTLSNFVKGSSVVDCDFWRTGDSAIIAVGSTKLTNATASEYPHMNSIERNYIDTVGVNMKQTSCYFKAMTYSNIIRDNMCFNGPRVRLHFDSCCTFSSPRRKQIGDDDWSERELLFAW